MQRDILIAIDVGNSTVRAAVFREGGIERYMSVAVRPLEGLAERLSLEGCGFAQMPGAKRLLVSSVCQEADSSVLEFAESLPAVRDVIFIKDHHVPLPVSKEIDNPDKVGIDRLLCGFGASKLYGFPSVVVGMGTAVTVDLIGESGCFEGGAIAPGPVLSARALHEWTSRLPQVAPGKREEACGRDTVSAIQSGIYHFCTAGVGALVSKFRDVSGGGAPVIITGGGMGLLDNRQFGEKCFRERDLLLKALWFLYNTNACDS